VTANGTLSSKVVLLAARTLRASAAAVEVQGAIGALRRQSGTQIDESYDLISAFSYGEIRTDPIQIKSECLELLHLLAEQPPKRVLEIGTARGGTLFLFTRVAAPDATLVTVDLPGGPFGGGYPRTRGRLLKSFARSGQQIHLIRGDSHSDETLDEVKRRVRDVDVLFIDGDHTYDGVRSDWEMYGELVRPGGMVVFHDIVDGPAKSVGGVPRFWSELRATYPDAREFVESRQQEGCGIGVIRRTRPDA
jgi:predicted O-methyltransferase YrrM